MQSNKNASQIYTTFAHPQMHLHAILTHFILLLACNFCAAVPPPASAVETDDIFSKLKPCMVSDVFVSVSLPPDMPWKASTTPEPH